jgi:hypothetical protein
MRRFPLSLPLGIAGLALLTLPPRLLAQRAVPPAIDRGSLVIDGGASLSRSRTTTETTGSAGTKVEVTSTQLSLLPSLLYFVAPRVAVGGSLELARAKSGATSSTIVGAGPAARLYFAGEGASALPYVGASTRVSRVSNDRDTGPSLSSTQWAFEGVAGLTWLFSRQVGIVTEAFARRVGYSAEGPGNASADITATELGLRVGVAAFIPRSR